MLKRDIKDLHHSYKKNILNQETRLASQLSILDRRFNKLNDDFGVTFQNGMTNLSVQKKKVVKAIEFKANLLVFNIKKSLSEILDLLKKKQDKKTSSVLKCNIREWIYIKPS